MFLDNIMNLVGINSPGGISAYGTSALRMLNVAGPVLAIVVYVLVLGNVFVFFFNLLPMIYLLYGPFSAWLISILGVYLGFNVWFNHSMGMTVKPGCLKDYYFPDETKSEARMRKEDVLHHKNETPSGGDMVSLMKFSQCDIESVMDAKGKRWERCSWFKASNQADKEKFEKDDYPFKPLRFHHWSICDDCVMNMDHHCPWFNNCVGLYNLRYFLLFLFHLWVSTIFMLFFWYQCRGHPFFYRYGSIASLAMGMHIGLFFGMGFFNGWQWYLCLRGIPQVEYIQTRVNKSLKSGGVIHDYGLRSWRDNLYFTFGTRNLLAMFLPSVRSLPFNGLEFTAQKKATSRY